jgi:predicted Zn-dependent peptidase
MVVKHVLDRGVTVLIDEMQDVRSFSLGFFVEAGSEDEPASRHGISHFLEHVLFKRTRRRSNVEIARAIDLLGGDVDAFTTKEYTGFYVHTLDASFGDALDLMGDIVLSPAFESEDIENERRVILEEIGEANDNPEDLVHEMFVRAFWKGHPLGAPILGTTRTVHAISREDLYSYHRSRYAGGNLIVAAAGHFRAGEVLTKVERSLRRRGKRVARPSRRRERRPAAHQHVQVQSLRALEQVHICMGLSAPSVVSGRRFAAHLLDIVLGGGMSSRLFQEVRERRGLVYSIGSALHSYRLGGYETISAACAPRNLPRVLQVIFRELRRLKRGGVRPRELRWAKENLKAGLLLALESTVSRMSAAARQEFYFGKTEAPEEWITRIEAVTEDQMEEEAERLIDGRALSLSVVGNVARAPVDASDLASAL